LPAAGALVARCGGQPITRAASAQRCFARGAFLDISIALDRTTTGVPLLTMQGLKKIGRAVGIVILPMIGAVIMYNSSDAVETVLGAFLIASGFGLLATWFWRLW
jgi:hypothetical protein